MVLLGFKLLKESCFTPEVHNTQEIQAQPVQLAEIKTCFTVINRPGDDSVWRFFEETKRA